MTAFFDTNILLYAQESGRKADLARTAIAGGGKISVQVLNEFAAVSRRKFRKEWREIEEAIEDALTLLDPPLALTLALHATARKIAQENGVSFYDALIVAAALEARCDTLLSEDMQDGRSIQGVTIVNPFAPTAV